MLKLVIRINFFAVITVSCRIYTTTELNSNTNSINSTHIHLIFSRLHWVYTIVPAEYFHQKRYVCMWNFSWTRIAINEIFCHCESFCFNLKPFLSDFLNLPIPFLYEIFFFRFHSFFSVLFTYWRPNNLFYTLVIVRYK